MEQGWSWDFMTPVPGGKVCPDSRRFLQGLAQPPPELELLEVAQSPSEALCFPKAICFKNCSKSKTHLGWGPNHYKHCGEPSSPFLLVWEVSQGLHICTG